jgi:hypothetical protein
MTNHFSTISSAILTKLQALTKLKYVYAYEKGQIEGYPAVTVYNSEYSAEWADTANDLDTYVFTMHIYQEMDLKAPDLAETIVNDALVELFQAFQADYTLGGKVDMMSIKASKGWTSREAVNRVAVVYLTLKKLNSIV